MASGTPPLRSWTAKLNNPRLVTTAKEIMLLGAAALFYSLVRGLTSDRVEAAFRHGADVISFERSIGLFVETDLQGLILDHGWAIDLANGIYIYGFWPALFVTLVWLLAVHPASYSLYRNAVLVSGALGLVLFAVFPLAPPRFLPEYGFVDTITLHARTYRELNSPTFVNEYAAMPSLHFGWTLIVGVAWIALSKHIVVKIMGVILPASMFLAIVMTGNHYVVDAIVGGLVAVTSVGIAVGIGRVTRQRAVNTAIPRSRVDGLPVSQPVSPVPARPSRGSGALTRVGCQSGPMCVDAHD